MVRLVDKLSQVIYGESHLLLAEKVCLGTGHQRIHMHSALCRHRTLAIGPQTGMHPFDC